MNSTISQKGMLCPHSLHWVTWIGSTRYTGYTENYGPCAGGLSAVNATGTPQLLDLINSKLAQLRLPR